MKYFRIWLGTTAYGDVYVIEQRKFGFWFEVKWAYNLDEAHDICQEIAAPKTKSRLYRYLTFNSKGQKVN